MPHRTFISFIWPSALAMMLFIALPIVSVAVQSLFIAHEQVIETVGYCGPFGCKTVEAVNAEATAQLRADEPLGRFNGVGTYTNRNHLAFAEIGTAWSESSGLGDFADRVLNLPFYKALAFTLTYTFVVTPLVIILGFVIALAVNRIPGMFKGPTIFVSLLPMIVTPLIGSLVLFWMIDPKGIIGATLQILLEDPNLSLKASTALTWLTLIVYGVWHSAPFAFVVFYAGLQTV
ncbi:MAG: sugar ABC transporter permease, partial [Rhodobiaceae bacterium]